MKRTRWRSAVACLAVIGAAVAVAGGSAGNRNGIATLDAVPGPGNVSYGENIAYKATFKNDNAKSGSVFTQTRFVMPPPVLPGGDETTFVAASCGTIDAEDVLTCEFGQLRPGNTVTLTVVWNVPAGEDLPGCEVDTDNDCLRADATWTVKEGKLTNPSTETWLVSELASLIGVGGADAVNANQSAGGYELAGCDGSSPSLVTSQVVDASTNPVTSSLCLPSEFVANGAAGGVAATITEPPSSASNYARHADVCIAKPGTNCGDNTYQAQDFGPNVVTFTFQVADEALPNGYKITQVFHNEELLTAETCSRAVNPECLVSITYDPPAKTWTIIATSELNGPWDW